MILRHGKKMACLAALLIAAPLLGCPPSEKEGAGPAPSVALAAAPSAPASPHYEAPMLKPLEFKQRQDRKEKILLVDVRSEAAYRREHAAGAVSVPYATLEEAQAKWPKDTLLVFYCTCPSDRTARLAATELHDKYGFTRLGVLEGGLGAWRAAALPTGGSGEQANTRGGSSGATLYAQHCATCHQTDGRGVPGTYPALTGNGLVSMADSRALTLVALNGLSPVPTAKQPDPARMPGFQALSDDDLAAILTHVRKRWGNQGKAVTAADVRAMRKP